MKKKKAFSKFYQNYISCKQNFIVKIFDNIHRNYTRK